MLMALLSDKIFYPLEIWFFFG